MEARKSVGVAYLLWFFLGPLGVHKFYLNKIGIGILYFLTGGIFLIGWFIDLFTLAGQVDTYNRIHAVSHGQQQPNFHVMSAMSHPAPVKVVSPETPEKQILKVVDKYEYFSFREVLMETELETEVAEATLEKLIQRGLIKKEVNEQGDEIYRG